MTTTHTLMAALTDNTCGDACWRAQEDICRCQCHGRNHGCLRTPAGEQPTRTRRINGAMYVLTAVESAETYRGSCRADSGRPIYALEYAIEDKLGTPRFRRDRVPTPPAVIKTASRSETSRWPELADWRGFRHESDRPLMLWLRSDLIPATTP